jgi:hypothetical protein
MIKLELTYQERDALNRALIVARSRYPDDIDVEALAQRVAKLPCGAKGCSYCDTPKPRRKRVSSLEAERLNAMRGNHITSM